MLRLLLQFILMLCVGTVAAETLPASVYYCERYAAYVWEPGHRETGWPWGSVDVDVALPACRAAYADAPTHLPTQFRLGRVLLQAGDYDRAMPLLKHSAEGGYVSSQTAYGTELMRDDAGAPDYATAYFWLRKATEGGDPVAAANLGIMYYYEEYGLPRDLDLYFNLQTRAAYAGVDFAQYNLGRSFELGNGLPIDHDEARRWYLMAAEQGHVNAQAALGSLMYHSGSQNDYAVARFWLERAREKGSSLAESEIGWAHQQGLGGPVDSTKARSSYERALALGSPLGARRLAWMYEQGFGVPANDKRALTFYIVAAWFGDAQAQFEIAQFFHHGKAGLKPSNGIALAWYLKAARQGLISAQMSAADIYSYDDAGTQPSLHNRHAAIYWYEQAFAAGRIEAAAKLALLYAAGGDWDLAQSFVSYMRDTGTGDLIALAEQTQQQLNLFKGDCAPPGQVIPGLKKCWD